MNKAGGECVRVFVFSAAMQCFKALRFFGFFVCARFRILSYVHIV